MTFLSPRPAIVIPGTWNARDIGGQNTTNGSIASGVLFRAASLSGLTAEGMDSLRSLRITTVCDLRSTEEVMRDGADQVPESTVVHSRPMDPAVGMLAHAPTADPAQLMGLIHGSDDPPAMARQVMHQVYRSFITHPGLRHQIGQALRDITHAPGATLVHCSAGKDRTGWLVALVQYLCGVDEDGRLEDYMASALGASALAAALGEGSEWDPEVMAPMLSVEPDYLITAWRTAVTEFGSIEGYLQECGWNDQDQLVTRFIS